LNERVSFLSAIYDLKEKIKKIDSSLIFILPSKREGMPQALIEAMAREKIVIASDNKGAKDIIVDNKNGFLFGIGNAEELAKKINIALNGKNGKMGKKARKSVERFSWDKIIRKIEEIIKK